MAVYNETNILLLPTGNPNPVPTFPANGGGSVCDGVVYSPEHFLDMFDRTFPFTYMQPLKEADDSGYELFESMSDVAARVSLATQRMECDSFIIYANAGSFATGQVTISRPTGSATQITFLSGVNGTVFTTDQGVDFALTLEVVFEPGDLEKTVDTVSVAQGYEWNVDGDFVSAGGELIPGEINAIKTLNISPPLAYTDWTVTNHMPTTGGAPDMLGAHGADQGMPQQNNESDISYRYRLRTLPDTVSPGAVLRNAHTILDVYPIPFEFIETFYITYQTCMDAPSPNPGTPSFQLTPPTNPQYDPNLFALDDQRLEPPFRDRYLDLVEMRGAFYIVLAVVTLDQKSLAFDDPGMVPSDFRDPQTGYGRGTPATDLTSSMDPSVVFGSCYDGLDITFNAAAAAVNNTLQQIRAAGVFALVTLQNNY